MRCGGWRIFDLPAAEMRNPLKMISAGFLLPAILERGGLEAGLALCLIEYISISAVTAT